MSTTVTFTSLTQVPTSTFSCTPLKHPQPRRAFTPPLTPPPEDIVAAEIAIAHKVQKMSQDASAAAAVSASAANDGYDSASTSAGATVKTKLKINTKFRASTSRVNPSLKVNTVTANNKKSSSRLGRLPSLKQISERLTTASTSSSDLAVLKDVTTTTANLPATTATASTTASTGSHSRSSSRSISPPTASTGSRLKLPASAMTRVNLSSSFVKAPLAPAPAAAAAASTSKEPSPIKEEQEPVTDAGSLKNAKNADHKVTGASVAPTPAPTPVKQPINEPRRARQSLGVGLPGHSQPETPQRNAKVADGNCDVPGLVVVQSTPERASDPAERTTNEDGEHPLAHKWALFYDSKTYKPDPSTVNKEGHLSSWEASLLTVGTVDTVQGFARHMNNIRLPSTLAKGANYHLFKEGIRPMWEDPANKAGGKWVMFIRGTQLLDSVWAFLAMALVGDMIDTEDKVCGLVVSARPKMDRIQVWTRTADDVEYLNGLAQRMLDTLGLGPGETENISLEFQPHAAGVKADPKLIKIQPPAVAVSRSVSLANIGNPNAPPHLRRSPSSPGIPFGPSPAHGAPTTNSPHGSSHLSTPLNGSPMRRSGSAGATAFSGPMGAFSGGLGAARRLVSTTPNAAA